MTPYLLDVNVLLALSLDNHIHHMASAEWFDEADFEWATTPLTEAAYVRLMTNSRMVGYSVSVPQAIEGLRELRKEPGFRFLRTTPVWARPSSTSDRWWGPSR